MKKEKIVRIITILFWIYILASILFSVLGIFFEVDFNYIKTHYTSSVIIVEYIRAIVLVFLITLIKNIIIIFLYVIFKLNIKNYKKEKLDENDIKEYQGYYREKLTEISVAELSYIDNFEIDYPNIIVATLLNLKLKNKIEFDKSKEKIEKMGDNSGLSKNEKYILDNIKDGKLKNFNKFNFLLRVTEDAQNNNLIQSSKLKLKKIITITAIVFLILIILGAISFQIFENINSDSVTNYERVNQILGFSLISIILFLFPSFSIVFIVVYIIRSYINPYVRTKKGKEINEKIEGLKNYLKDYSTLEDKRSRAYGNLGRIFNIFYNV